MSKTLTSAQSLKTQQKLGAEPVVLVSVELGESYGTLKLADKNLTVGSDSYLGKILSLSNFRTDRRVDNLGTVSELTVTLDDSTGYYRQSLNAVRWCGKTVRVYHHFVGVDPLLILVGKVSTPVEWDEEQEQFVFNILTINDGEDVGCITDDDDTTIDEAARGKNVPIVFGTVIDLEGLKIVKPITGKLLDAVQITTVSTKPVTIAPFKVENGSDFPQNTQITLIIGEQELVGSFNGDVFTVTNAVVDNINFVQIVENDPEKQLGKILTTYLPKNLVGKQISMVQDYTTGTAPAGSGSSRQYYFVMGQKTYFDWLNQKYLELTLDRAVITGGFETLTLSKLYGPAGGSPIEIKPSFKWLQPGTPVLWKNHTETVFAINCETTIQEILSVKAYREIEIAEGTKKKFLVEVPDHLYTFNSAYEIAGHIYNVIIFERPLSLQDESWDDEIYVSMRSNVGPNISEIIKWILNNYTEVSLNIPSFDTYATQIDKYPANFAILKSQEALSLAAEIAYQARTALRITNGIVSVIYLSTEPSSVKTIGDDDLVEATFLLELSEVTEIVTHLKGTFKENYGPETKEQTVNYKNNVSVFGYKDEEIDFYIFNSKALVQKSLNFWGYRKSNQWIRAKFSTFLTTLELEIFDCISSNIDIHATKMLIDNVDFDSDNNAINYEVWTPVIAGTNTQAALAWLSDSGDVKPAAPTVTTPDIPEYQKVLTITPISGFPSPKDGASIPGKITSSAENGVAIGDLYANGLGAAPTQVGVPLNVMGSERLDVDEEVVVTKAGVNHYVKKAGGISSLKAGGTDAEILVPANSVPTPISNGVAGAGEGITDLSEVIRVVKISGVAYAMLNIRDLRIYDPASGFSAAMDDLFRIVAQNQIALRTTVLISDGTNSKVGGWKYDSTNQKWIMEGTFLQAT